MPDKEQPLGILKTQHDGGSASTPATFLGLRSGSSPRTTPKAVSITTEASILSPLSIESHREASDLDSDRDRPRIHRAKSSKSKRLTGRPSLRVPAALDDSDMDPDMDPKSVHHPQHLIEQVHVWLRRERTRHEARRAKRHEAHARAQHTRNASDVSDDGPDLDTLEQILKESFPFVRPHRRDSSTNARRPSIRRLLHRSSPMLHASSDTDYFDGEVTVPKVEAWLDNTKVHGQSGGSASCEDLTRTDSTVSEQAWATFKYEILRLTHTLRLKGWRRVPMDESGELDVQRLSGALTNAVYVVTPPEVTRTPQGDDSRTVSRRLPRKLLLRVYGPQVEHLIDRDAELEILSRLARKKIGPRLLGTFTNGRFEEYLHALPLTPKDLRAPVVSEQIAKRMRELHDGIELLDIERDAGPFVWKNWDKWVQRVEELVTWLDARLGTCGGVQSGHVCGTKWRLFRSTVERYRAWLVEQSGGVQRLREELVFSHNDTQYGNILRITPSGTSPLLLPANSHKQLVVIDFEYSSQNPPGLEFANHFSEWCYDYHDEKYSWRCNAAMYPTPEEQTRFLRAYVRHKPDLESNTPCTTPLETVMESPYSPDRAQANAESDEKARARISTFLLDARAGANTSNSTTLPPSIVPSKVSEPLSHDMTASDEVEVKRMMRQIRMWRTACSAQWIAWGIVQAQIPGMPPVNAADDASGPSSKDVETAEEGFDYLAYARDRAMFFWGDAVAMGLAKLEELPADVQRDIKIVDY